MRITFLYRTQGQAADGILDYSRCLIDALGELPGVDATLLTIQPNGKVLSRRKAAEGTVGLRAAIARLRASDAIVVQYQPFSFGRWGFAPWLPVVAGLLRRRRVVTVMVHEPYLRNQRGRRVIMAVWQRLQLRVLMRRSDVVFVSTQPWLALMARDAPRIPMVHLPVGSNLPDRRVDREVVRDRLGVGDTLIVSLIWSGHEGTLLPLIDAALQGLADEGLPFVLMQLGTGVPLDVPPSATLLRPGWLPAEEIAGHLAASDIFLAPYIDGVSTRRTAVAAAACNGVAVATTSGSSTGEPADWASSGLSMVDAEDSDAFRSMVLQLASDEGRRAQAAREAHAYFTRERDWRVIATRLYEHVARAAARRSSSPG